MITKTFIKSLTPPIVGLVYRKLFSKTISFLGNYTWKEAAQKSTGFHYTEILNRVKASATKVKEGKATYERDGVLHNKIDYSWPVLACLENVALQNDNCLHLIDFGGSLGTSYFQNRKFLKSLSLKWYVVEQAHYVDCGKKEFQNEHLKFEYTIEEVLKKEKINCLLVSGSFQYLENPVEYLKEFKNHSFEYIIFDRTSFIEDNTRLTIQMVPASIYPASLPCWFFNEPEFINQLIEQYELIADFDSTDGSTWSSDNKRMYWKGIYFKLRT
jgi:putative methyltransferase (TIGR04325 family)